MSSNSFPRIPFLLLALSLTLVPPSSAAERVWDGNGRSADWTDAGNWSGLGGVPAAGDDLRFPAGALKLSNANDFSPGFDFNRLTFAGAGYSVSGNEIDLAAGIVVSHGSGNTILNLPINIAANQTILVSLTGANLFLNGALDLLGTRPILTFDGAGQTVLSGNLSDGRVIGGGTIRKNGTGRLHILSQITLNGSTIVDAGTLHVDGSLSNSAVTLNAGATLMGVGKVGGITANTGSIVHPGGATSPDIFDSLGNVALNAGATLNIRLNGTSAGLNYDQLRVQGAVTLGAALNVTASFIPDVGQVFTIIANDGTDDTVGSFAGLPQGAILTINGRPFQISYGNRGGIGGTFGRDPNDVTLEAIPALAIWDGGGNLNKFWTQPLNWVGDVVPLPGDDVQFANSGSGILTAFNDFPAGRLFGSLLLAGGDIRLEGNAAEFTDVHLSAPGVAEVYMPVGVRAGIRASEAGSIRIFGAVSLRATQTFRTERTNSFVSIFGNLEAANHNLTIDGVWSSGLNGIVNGSGQLIKEGNGTLFFDGTNGFSAITVNAGALDVGGHITGLVTVNAGAFVGGSGRLQDLDVMGGTLAPFFSLVINGRGRMLNKATLVTRIVDQGANGVHSTYAYASGQAMQLTDCNLVLDVLANANIPLGYEFTVIGGPFSGAVTGAFNGLPEGSRILVNGHDFILSYKGGLYSNYVTLTAGAPYVWDGSGSGNLWGTGANWVADVAPIPNRDLIFPAGVSKLGMLNAFDVATQFRSLLFTAPSYVLAGNSFRLTEGIYNDVASGDTTITADFSVTSGNFTNRVAGASRLLLEGAATGNAAWKKSGPGTLRFTGTLPNSHNSLDVREGRVELDKPSGVNAISGGLTIGDGTNDIRVTLLTDHQIADAADVTIRNRARLDLNGNDETIDRLQGDGTVSLNDGRLAQLRSARLSVSNGAFAGAIVGAGGLTKIGSSSSLLTLSGPNTYTGMTIVSGGTLAIESAQPESPVQLNGGALRGRGSVGAITATAAGGTLQPGSGGADFQVALRARNVTLNSAATFRPLLTSIDPGYENHKLQVTGSIDLGGSALSIDLIFGFNPGTNRIFTIIENDGSDPIIGTFANLPEGAIFGGDGLPFKITYLGGTGNDIVLTRFATPASTLNSITRLTNGTMSLEGLGMSGVIYPIQAATNLNPTIQWTPIGNAPTGPNGLFQFIDTAASNRPMRFYRAISP